MRYALHHRAPTCSADKYFVLALYKRGAEVISFEALLMLCYAFPFFTPYVDMVTYQLSTASTHVVGFGPEDLNKFSPSSIFCSCSNLPKPAR